MGLRIAVISLESDQAILQTNHCHLLNSCLTFTTKMDIVLDVVRFFFLFYSGLKISGLGVCNAANPNPKEEKC